ncbi:MAG: DUF1289 domain-containing protein [Candidatus Puniceispirillaceae bacterium]
MEKIPSPCISICQIDSVRQTCKGCFRTRQEIARWPAMDGVEQHQLLAELKQRRADQTGIVRRQTARQHSAR